MPYWSPPFNAQYSSTANALISFPIMSRPAEPFHLQRRRLVMLSDYLIIAGCARFFPFFICTEVVVFIDERRTAELFLCRRVSNTAGCERHPLFKTNRAFHGRRQFRIQFIDAVFKHLTPSIWPLLDAGTPVPIQLLHMHTPIDEPGAVAQLRPSAIRTELWIRSERSHTYCFGCVFSYLLK